MKKFLTSGWFHFTLLTLVLIASVFYSFSGARWREQIRNFTFDNYNILKPRQASDDIVIIDIDEASLREVGQMPWPRTVMAQLVKNLDAMGAKLIVFDIVFAEPDRISPKAISKKLSDIEGFEDMAERLNTLPDSDTLFGVTIGEAGNVVTGFSFTNEQTDASPRQKGIFRGRGLDAYIPNLVGASANLKTISRFAEGNGSFFVSTDTDGIIRRVPMLVAHSKADSSIVSVYPSLSLETVRVLRGERGGRVVLADDQYAQLDPDRFGIEGIQVGADTRLISTNARGEFLVYFAPSNKDWYIPAHQALDGSLPAETIKDKIVFIGTSAVGLKDIRSTPLDTFVPGVEVHLNIVDQIMQNKFLTRSIEAEGAEAVGILMVGLAVIVLAPFVGAVLQALIVSLAVGATLFAGWFAFTQYGILIDVTYPSLSILLIFMLSVILTYIRTEREKREVRQAFGLYISPDFMRELTKDPDKLKLGGEIRDLSVMFTDIRSFTTISEGLSPEELIQLMNDFLTPMSDMVMQNRGTIDKYMGDAMMAFWNAPLDDPDHVRHACKTALGMQAALAPINRMIEDRAKEAGKDPVLLNAGIGINTGPCAVGNMGSRQRFAYSALGDAVNIASRFEGQTKTYGADILIGEDTQKHVPELATLEVDLIQVKGKSLPVRMFALIGDEAVQKSGDFKDWKLKHDEMLDLYRSQEFKEAKLLIKQCLKISGSKLKETYSIYETRCSELIKTPPNEDWDGVFVATSK